MGKWLEAQYAKITTNSLTVIGYPTQRTQEYIHRVQPTSILLFGHSAAERVEEQWRNSGDYSPCFSQRYQWWDQGAYLKFCSIDPAEYYVPLEGIELDVVMADLEWLSKSGGK